MPAHLGLSQKKKKEDKRIVPEYFQKYFSRTEVAHLCGRQLGLYAIRRMVVLSHGCAWRLKFLPRWPNSYQDDLSSYQDGPMIEGHEFVRA